jgi:hypothetical protein
MFRGRIFAAAAFAVMITAGLTATESIQAGGFGAKNGSLHAVTVAYRTPASPSCSPIPSIAHWSWVYSACESVNDTFLRLTNTSVWDDLLLQVRYPSRVHLTITWPETDSPLLDLVEELEFPASIGSYAVLVVPPGSTLSATSLNGTPVRLFISVDQYYTPWNVAAEGLVDTVQDYVAPGLSEAESILACSKYVHSLPGQLNQWQATSPEFWNSFANAIQCRGAFHGWSELIGGGEKGIIDDAEHDTDPFFDNLFKFIDLAGEELH